MRARVSSSNDRPAARETITYWERIIVHQTISPSQQPSSRCCEFRCATARSRARTRAGSTASFTGEVLFPLANGQLLKQVDGWIQFGKRRVEITIVSLLFRFDREPVLPEKRLDGNHIRNSQKRSHEQLRYANAGEWNLQRVKIKEEKHAAVTLVDRQDEAPVLDLPTGVGPLVRIFVAEFDEVCIHAIAINEQAGKSPCSDLRV